MTDREPTAVALERAVAGSLRDAINAHGPITPEWIGSAVKRVIGNLPNASAEDDGWIDLAADDIAGDPSCLDAPDRIADIIRGHVDAAKKR